MDFELEENESFVLTPVVDVAESKTGMGVYTRTALAIGCIVGEVEGEIIDDLSYSSDYCIDLENGSLMEPASPFRFVNHSCEPNCELDWSLHECDETQDSRLHVFITAIKPINAGDEITIDYNWPISMGVKCLCGSSICRGTVGWVVEDEEEYSIDD